MSKAFDMKKALLVDDGEEEIDEGQDEIEETEEPDTVKALTHDDHLESILFQFVNLYERWSEDRQVAAKQSSDIARFIKEFAGQVASFETFKEEIQAEIKENIHNEAKNMAVYMGRLAGDAIKKEVEPTVLKLQALVSDSEQVLSRHEVHSTRAYWASIVLSGITSIIASLIIVKLLMPVPVVPLTQDQMATYQSGQVLESVWPKLSAKEKQWFLNIAKGKANGHEKISYEKIS